MALLDLLGRRWTLRIIWELRGEGLGFRRLQLRCEGMSPSVLSQRLRELDDARVLELADGRYQLTAEGRELLDQLAPLQTWADRWARGATKRPANAGDTKTLSTRGEPGLKLTRTDAQARANVARRGK